MRRYIDADNAIERLGAYLMTDAQIEYWGLASKDIDDWKPIAVDILKGTPSINIVRCRECIYGQDDLFHMFCECHHHKTYADDFCSYGKARDE